MTVNAKAMQVAGALKEKDPSKLSPPSDVLPRYMTMGSWKQNLHTVPQLRRSSRPANKK